MKLLRIKYILAVLSMIGGMLVALPVEAAKQDGEVAVEVLEALAITQTGSLDFGKVVKPSTGTETITITTNDVVTGNITRAGGAPAAATFDISGSDNNNVTISITNLINAATGLTLDSVTYQYGSGSGSTVGTTVTPISGQPLLLGQPLRVGGTLSVASTAQAAPYLLPMFTVNVDYE